MLIFTKALWDYLLVSAPYLLFGLILSGFIRAFISIDDVKKFLGQKGIKDIFWASLIGVPLPLCSCSVIPTAVTLKKSGASNAATAAFLISTPESGIDSILLTYALMDLPMSLLRPLAAFTSGFFAGVAQLLFNTEKHESHEKIEAAPTCHACCCSANPEIKKEEEKLTLVQKLKNGARFAFVDLIDDLAFWLTIGILAGALITVLIPSNFFTNVSGFQSRLMILAIGIPLYICASASTPVAAALIMKGLSPGAALLFLLVGPATNISNIVVMQKYIGKKGVFINVMSIIIVALVFSYVTDWLYFSVFDSANLMHNMHIQAHVHNVQTTTQVVFSNVVAVLFSGLLIKGLVKKYFPFTT